MIEKVYIKEKALEIVIKSGVYRIYNTKNNIFECDIDKLLESAKKIENYLNGEDKNANI